MFTKTPTGSPSLTWFPLLRFFTNAIIFSFYRQIHIDIPRMSPVVGLFQQRCVQEIFERILYIWAIRHPASGYVQGKYNC